MGPLKAAGLDPKLHLCGHVWNILSEDSNSTRPNFSYDSWRTDTASLSGVTVSQLPIEKLLFVCVVAHVMGADQ